MSFAYAFTEMHMYMQNNTCTTYRTDYEKMIYKIWTNEAKAVVSNRHY